MTMKKRNLLMGLNLTDKYPAIFVFDLSLLNIADQMLFTRTILRSSEADTFSQKSTNPL